MTARRPSRHALPRWQVTVAAHRIEPRWNIPAASLEVHAQSVELARLEGALAFHVRAAVPPFRAFTARTLGYVTAERIYTPE